jgi:hypothetical protein
MASRHNARPFFFNFTASIILLVVIMTAAANTAMKKMFAIVFALKLISLDEPCSVSSRPE